MGLAAGPGAGRPAVATAAAPHPASQQPATAHRQSEVPTITSVIVELELVWVEIGWLPQQQLQTLAMSNSQPATAAQCQQRPQIRLLSLMQPQQQQSITGASHCSLPVCMRMLCSMRTAQVTCSSCLRATSCCGCGSAHCQAEGHAARDTLGLAGTGSPQQHPDVLLWAVCHPPMLNCMHALKACRLLQAASSF